MDTLLSRGLVGPFQLDDVNLVARVEDLIVGGLSPVKDRHIDNENIRAVFLDRNLQSKVEQYFGKNLLLWRSNFFVKKESSGEIGWHHDRHFENEDELINFQNLNNRSIAEEFKKYRINVNELIPGAVKTEMNPNASGDHWKSPEDIAPLAIFLAGQDLLKGASGQSFSLKHI